MDFHIHKRFVRAITVVLGAILFIAILIFLTLRIFLRRRPHLPTEREEVVTEIDVTSDERP